MAPKAFRNLRNLQGTGGGVKGEKMTVGANLIHSDIWNKFFQRYSAWDQLRRIVAWHMRAL